VDSGAGEGGNVAVVTGGARGIGAAVAARLAHDGWDVIAGDITVPSGAEERDGIEHCVLDVTERADVQALFARVLAERGRLDLLVNNAGITRQAPLALLSWDDWSAVVDVNMHGVFNCLQAAGRHMLAQGHGSIVNISSIAAERGSPMRAAYSATKAAVNGLTRAAAAEWAADGLRVNAVGPGYVATGVYAEGVANGRIRTEDVLARIPAGRVATPAEIADAVAYLASSASRYINGHILYVDGGFLADFGVPPAKAETPS
jgi:3-oxoacyl-[acyl-carrier protein] reductase